MVSAALMGALVLLAIVAAAATASFAVKARSLEGFWASRGTGRLYRITPGAGREFSAACGFDTPGQAGRLSRFRGVRLAGPAPKVGRVEPGGRHIAWRDGDVWWRQGVGSG
jgi:hypothetical protein